MNVENKFFILFGFFAINLNSIQEKSSRSIKWVKEMYVRMYMHGEVSLMRY